MQVNSFEGKPLTKREIAIAREAWMDGRRGACWRDPATEESALRTLLDDARSRFPMPPTVVPRVITNNGTSWKVEKGCLWSLECGYNQATWKLVVVLGDPGFEKELAALLMAPTKIVESDE